MQLFPNCWETVNLIADLYSVKLILLMWILGNIHKMNLPECDGAALEDS